MNSPGLELGPWGERFTACWVLTLVKCGKEKARAVGRMRTEKAAVEIFIMKKGEPQLTERKSNARHGMQEPVGEKPDSKNRLTFYIMIAIPRTVRNR